MQFCFFQVTVKRIWNFFRVCSLSELLILAVGKHFSLLLCKIVSVQKAADQIQASVLPKQDYCLEVTHTTVTSGKNLHVGLHLLIKFPH